MKTTVSPGASAPSRLHCPRTSRRDRTPRTSICLRFYRALNNLYNRSVRGTAPAFIAEYLDRGKPEQIVKLARQNRFKQEVPGVIRPDLILTADGFVATELDSIPGGMGFVGAMTEAYCQLGIESLGGDDGIPIGFAAMLRLRHARRTSDRRDRRFRRVGRLPQRNGVARGRAAPSESCRCVAAPARRDYLHRRGPLHSSRGRARGAARRDLSQLRALRSLQRSQSKSSCSTRRVTIASKITPPPKAPLEEKLAFALLHHHALAPLWRAELGNETFERLQRLFPKTWVIDPRPLPPQGVIAGLEAGGAPISDFRQLIALPKSERAYVVKPSGFSELAWGSRGVKIGDDLTREEWTSAIENGARIVRPHAVDPAALSQRQARTADVTSTANATKCASTKAAFASARTTSSPAKRACGSAACLRRSRRPTRD